MQKVLPDFSRQVDDGLLLVNGDLSVKILPDVGGRISSVNYAGSQVILTPDTANNPNGWGNVLWPSPQSDWGWPPPATLDYLPYTLEKSSTDILLKSAVDKQTGLVFEKHYRPAKSADTLRIHYRITNHSNQPKTLAPWEITRVPAAGVAFFPRGESDFYAGSFADLPVTERDGIVWYKTDAHTYGPENHKLMTDGAEGWLAYVNQNVLMVKSFTDVPAELMAPSEGEIEIYTNAAHTYVELEQQGSLTTLMPGESLEWTVLWAFTGLSEEQSADRQQWLELARDMSRRN